MVSMSDELKERNILKLILIVRFACATLDVGHPIISSSFSFILHNASPIPNAHGVMELQTVFHKFECKYLRNS
jgi:hypothetical protein